MSEITCDIGEMLDGLGLTTAAIRWRSIQDSTELGNYSSQQLLQEILTAQYSEAMNRRYETNLRLSKLINKQACVEKLKTGNGRKYNYDIIRQILTFRFVPKHLNIGIYGKTGAGKNYCMSAICNEACRQNYRSMLVDYCDLLDELLILVQKQELEKYRKRLKYYSKIRILFIDDFCISRYLEEGIKILYHLLKTRDDLGYPTVFTSQHAPNEWGQQLSDDPQCFGKLDGIRRRLTSGYTVEIVKL